MSAIGVGIPDREEQTEAQNGLDFLGKLLGQASGTKPQDDYRTKGTSYQRGNPAIDYFLGTGDIGGGGGGGGGLFSGNTEVNETTTVVNTSDSRIGASDQARVIKGNKNTIIDISGGDYLGALAIDAMLQTSAANSEFLSGTLEAVTGLKETQLTGGQNQTNKTLLMAGAGVLVFLTLLFLGPKMFKL